MRIKYRAFILVLLGVFAASLVKAGSPELPQSTAPALTIIVGGQSNAGGFGVPYSFWGAPEPYYDSWIVPGRNDEHVAWGYYKNGRWGILADPLAGGSSIYPRFTNQYANASVWPMVARELLPVIGNVAFIPCEMGGTSWGSWLYVPPPPGVRPIDDMIARVHESGQTPQLAVWWQGETDQQQGTPPESIKTWTTQIDSILHAEFGSDLMPCKIQGCGTERKPGWFTTNAAIGELWGTGNIVQGPDLSDISTAPESSSHIITPEKRRECAHRWAQCILVWWAARQP